MDWTDDAILRLRNLWDEGLSTAEIGRRLGISKNSVVGKAHRLQLSPRPSPIRRDPMPAATPREPTHRRMCGPTLPSFATPVAEIVLRPAVKDVVPRGTSGRPEPSVLAIRPSLVAAMAAPIRLSPRTPACCWPIGEPGTPSFHFCGDPALANKPYCQPHADIAYVRVRDRRDEVA